MNLLARILSHGFALALVALIAGAGAGAVAHEVVDAGCNVGRLIGRYR